MSHPPWPYSRFYVPIERNLLGPAHSLRSMFLFHFPLEMAHQFYEELPWCESSLWLSPVPNSLLLVIILRRCSFKARRRNPPFSAALGHIRQRAGGSRSPLHGEGSGGLCSARGSPETRSPAASTALLPREPPRAAALAH